MGAAEALSDAVLGKCADLMDQDTPASEQFWFAVLSLGNRVGCSSYTDTSLTHRRAMSPGDRRVYCRADRLSYPGVVGAMRAGRTFATNAGPVFPFLSVAGRGPGDVLTPEQARGAAAEVEVQSLHPLKSVELVWNGKVVHAEPVPGKDRPVRFRHPLPEPGPNGDWLVLRAKDDHGNWAITSPVYVGDGAARRKGASVVLLEVSNHTRFIQLRKDFFAHLVVTVAPDDELREVTLLRDGEPIRRFRPADGSKRSDNKAPVTERDGDYGPGWEWAVRNDRTVHLQADWPVAETGWYRVRATTTGGKVIESDEVRYDTAAPNSRAISTAALRGPGVEYTVRGYGSEMPLDRVTVPFAGDHWWYPNDVCWERAARFGGAETVHTGGRPEKLTDLIRRPARK
jgi:hypothetical protein